MTIRTHRGRRSFDQDNRPRGEGGELIRLEAGEANESDIDRVFELDEEGRVTTVYPRMSVHVLQETLPSLGRFLREAAERGAEIAVVE